MRGGREGAGWTTGWKIAEVMFCGGLGGGGSGAICADFDGDDMARRIERDPGAGANKFQAA